MKPQLKAFCSPASALIFARTLGSFMAMINQSRFLRQFFAACRQIGRGMTQSAFSELHVRHPERIPDSGPAFFLPTHQTTFDPFIVDAILIDHIKNPRAVHYAAWSSLFDLPILGSIEDALPTIGVAPNNPRALRTLFQRMEDLFAQEESVVMFPEGTLANPSHLSPIKGGVGRVSEHIRNSEWVPAVPISIDIPDKYLLSYTIGGIRWVVTRNVQAPVYVTIGESYPISDLTPDRLEAGYRRLRHPLRS